MMRLSHASILFSALFSTLIHAATEEHPKPCTIKSPNTGTYYDLNPMAVRLPEEGSSHKKSDRNASWTARGYDYGANFTINFCEPVVEELKGVEGVDEHLWRNVSAFYTMGGKTYSIGSLNTEPLFRGRKFVLNFTDGSPCGQKPSKPRRELIDDGDDDDKNGKKKEPEKSIATAQRKNTIISLLCDRDTVDPTKPKVGVSLVGWSPDECTYSFEARSQFACGGLSAEPQAVGPGEVFGIIALIALAVYILGGIAYQRTVMHQRGWRQLPNYSMWAGVASFFWNLVLMLFSSCASLLPRRRGYNQLPTTASRGRGPNREDENRLIDQLDEEWDD